MTAEKVILLSSALELAAINAVIKALREEINDENIVPDRFGTNLKSALSESDANILGLVEDVLHRLTLNAKYPTVRENNYVEVNNGEKSDNSE
jgi:hypothetical protein